MFYKYRLSDNRILVASPDILTHGVDEAVIEIGDEAAYLDPTQVYRITDTLDGVEVDPTYVEPPYDIPDAVLRAAFEVLFEEANRVRGWLGKPLVDWQAFKGEVKDKL
ncbi:hypothetical protein KAR91_60980 [Candidatus Pacearchaeota archaeon]|nr:hypothetical protein [Candidatus Pacearchaeota archaeon]